MNVGNEKPEIPREDPAQSTKERLDSLEEAIKERQPSLLGALKTLAIDIDAFRRGQRDFPQAALLGAVFAYLRPRIVLALGSIAAIIIAGAQIWILASQNRLIEQQNAYIEQQSYALKAQTVAALLAGFNDSEQPSKAQIATLRAFGDIGFDALLVLAEQTGATGAAAREALVSSQDKLSLHQQRLVFDVLIAAHQDEFLALLAKAEGVDPLTYRLPERSVAQVLAGEGRRPFVEPLETRSALDRFVSGLSFEFLREHRNAFGFSFGETYELYIDAYGVLEDDWQGTLGQLDRTFSRACGGGLLVMSKGMLRSEMEKAMQAADVESRSESATDVIVHVMQTLCGSREPDA